MNEEDLRWGLSSGSEYDSEDSNGTYQIHFGRFNRPIVYILQWTL